MNRHTLASFAAVIAVGCQSSHPESHEEEKFLVTNPQRTNTAISTEYVAKLCAIQHIELRALSRGYVQGIFVDEGQRIAKGTKMFQIMPVLYQAELQKANAEASLAEIEYNNTKLLAEKNIVSPAELALTSAKRERARAEVSLAATHRALTEIRAPFDGLMGRFNVRMGSLVDEGELLTTMSDTDKIWAYFNVSEAEYLAYRSRANEDKGAEVKLLMANGKMFDQLGRVETIEADFNNETGNIAFRAAFLNPKNLLRHGETGKVVMTTPLEKVLLIPQKATFDILDKKYVFVVDDAGVAHSRHITVSAELPHIYVVESGLEETERIVIEGLRKVADGATIAVEYQHPGQVFAHLEVPVE